MKKIIAAGIVRVLEFDRADAAETYLVDLAWKQIKYQVNWREDLEDGRVLMNITTAYNNNALIEKIKEIAKEGESNGRMEDARSTRS